MIYEIQTELTTPTNMNAFAITLFFMYVFCSHAIQDEDLRTEMKRLIGDMNQQQFYQSKMIEALQEEVTMLKQQINIQDGNLLVNQQKF